MLERLNQKNKGKKKGNTGQGVWQKEGGIHDITDFPTPAQARQASQRTVARNGENPTATTASPPGGTGTPSSPPQAAMGSLAAPAAADEDNGMDYGVAGQRRKREENEEDPELHEDDDGRKSSFRRGGEGGTYT